MDLLNRVHRQHVEGDQSRSRQDIVCRSTAAPKCQLSKRGEVVRMSHMRRGESRDPERETRGDD